MQLIFYTLLNAIFAKLRSIELTPARERLQSTGRVPLIGDVGLRGETASEMSKMNFLD